MNCAKCSVAIDDDSNYCDQCGGEVMLCLPCGVPRKGKVCLHCGDPLVPASRRQTAAPVAAPSPVPPAAPVAGPPPVPPAAGAGTLAPQRFASTIRSGPTPSAPPSLRLINRTVNLDLAIQPGLILGRTQGPLATELGGFGEISGRHCQFQYAEGLGWTVTDLGSTNHTFYQGRVLSPHAAQPLQPRTLLKVANVEFFLEIEEMHAGGRP